MKLALGSVFLVASLASSGGCRSGSTLEFPLKLGTQREDAEELLVGKKLCRRESAELAKQSYVRCKTKGFTIGDSWLVVDYDRSGRVVRALRLEHYPKQSQATKRWNALVEARRETLGGESQDAREQLASLGEAPAGAVVWKAWRQGPAGHLLGVYLVKPEEEGKPNVVEVLRPAPR